MAIKMETVNRGKQLLVMTIEIGDGRQDFIAVYEKDDPSALAQEFSSKYNLDSTLTRNLSIMIKENKNEVLSKGLHLQETSESESFSQSPYVSNVFYSLCGCSTLLGPLCSKIMGLMQCLILLSIVQGLIELLTPLLILADVGKFLALDYLAIF